jgi:hypothetical protein
MQRNNRDLGLNVFVELPPAAGVLYNGGQLISRGPVNDG